MPRGPTAPKTLEELATLLDITMGDLGGLTEPDFEVLLVDELEISSKAREKLKKQHRELLEVRKKADQVASDAEEDSTTGVDMMSTVEPAHVAEEIAAMVAPADGDELQPSQSDSAAETVRYGHCTDACCPRRTDLASLMCRSSRSNR